MPIRLRNIDRESEGGKRHTQVADVIVSAVSNRIIFAAPLACEINSIDLYSKNGVTAVTVVARLATDSDATLGSLSALVSEARNRITPSANNSLSTGTPIELLVSASTSPSATLIHITYKPLTGRESR